MVVALILSGGTGSRVGADVPKQYIPVNGRPLIMYSLETLTSHPCIDAIQIVADISWQELIKSHINIEGLSEKFKGFSNPGENRQLSIYNGLIDISKYAKEDDLVLIHDAARPNLKLEMISTYINGAKGYDGLMPVLPMKDTVYLSYNGDKVDKLLNREQIVAGQAPELFVLGKYYEANRRLLPDKILEINGSSEPAVMAGMNIAIVPGDEANFKITTASDLERFEDMVINRKG